MKLAMQVQNRFEKLLANDQVLRKIFVNIVQNMQSNLEMPYLLVRLQKIVTLATLPNAIYEVHLETSAFLEDIDSHISQDLCNAIRESLGALTHPKATIHNTHISQYQQEQISDLRCNKVRFDLKILIIEDGKL